MGFRVSDLGNVVRREPANARKIFERQPVPTSAPLTQPILHFEPSLDALSLRSDVISSIKILSDLAEHTFSGRCLEPFSLC